MPNHVHVLLTPNVSLAKLMKSLKTFSSRRANAILGLTGQPFWAEESYDRLVRNRAEFERIRIYIEMNPVQAGIVSAPEEYMWSSAQGPTWMSAADREVRPTG